MGNSALSCTSAATTDESKRPVDKRDRYGGGKYTIGSKDSALVRKDKPPIAQIIVTAKTSPILKDRRDAVESSLIQHTVCTNGNANSVQLEEKELSVSQPTVRANGNANSVQLEEEEPSVTVENRSSQPVVAEAVNGSLVQTDDRDRHLDNEQNPKPAIEPLASHATKDQSGSDYVCRNQEYTNSLKLQSETECSTNEELQATLQELGDLQRNVNQLAEENEQLGAERMVLLQSLCTQTEKLENARTQIEHLKALILSDTEHSLSEREQELVNLLKGATEEREELLLKQCEIHHALESFDLEYKDMQERVLSLTEQCKLLEEKRRDLQDEKKEMESHMAELEEELANERIELERYKTLLENEKGKVLELQQLHKAEDKSELEQLLENTRADKEKVEQRCANLQETLAHSRRELGKTKEQLQLLEEELILARNNNKTCLSDLEYKYDKVSADRGQLEAELRDLREKLEESRKESNRLIEENRSHRIAVSDLQAELKGAKHRYIEFEKEMKALSQRHEEEASDWKQFQSDLQTAVVIANAIKAEAVEDKERLIDKNNEMARQMDDLQKQLNSVQAELERVKAQKSLSVLPTGEIKKHLLGSDRELAALRQGRRLSDLKGNQNIVSVKTLIKSIEGQGSLGSSTGSSRRGSSDSLNSPTTVTTNFSNHIESSRNSPERRSSQTEPPLKSALKKPNNEEKQRPRTIYDKTSSPVIESLRPVSSDNSVSSLLSMRSENDYNDKNFDPLAKLVKQTGGSKRNALLKWCQLRTRGYSEVDVTNFSSSWNDGLAFCALLHNYIPDKIPFDDLCSAHDKRRNFTTAFQAAESVGIPPTLNVNEMVSIERPDWQTVMSYVTSIYTHFECD